MPNHVHVVVQPIENISLSRILHSWKSYTASEANKIAGRQGEFWQRESYDHVVRDERDLVRVLAYVRDNPLKAGMENWPWVRVYEDRLQEL